MSDLPVKAQIAVCLKMLEFYAIFLHKNPKSRVDIQEIIRLGGLLNELRERERVSCEQHAVGMARETGAAQ
jgi:hypothetical protein